jgi:hypothetical protein
LNPSPILAPNVDTLYAGGWLDLAQAQLLIVPDAAHDPAGPRYLVIVFYDMYANVPFTIGTQNYPHGGRFCLISNPAQAAICHAVPGGVTATIQLPRYSAVIGRVYSLGLPTSCVDLQTGAVQQGVDGCFTVDRILLQPLGTPLAPLLNPFVSYAALMNPNSPTACGYHWKHPPCFGGSRKAFWDAICLELTQSPVSPAEAQYINDNFAVFGIHSTGCSNVNYAALDLGWDDGVEGVKWAQSHQPVVSSEDSNRWQAYPFDGVWPINPLGLVYRANNGFIVPNAVNVYWMAFWESHGKADQRLTGANGNVYRVDWREVVPVDYDNFGFWSVTLYDETWYPVGATSKTFGVRGNTPVVPSSFTIAAHCDGISNCVVAPEGPFQLIIRGYNPTQGLMPGTSYEFPKVRLCRGNGKSPNCV